MSEERIPAPEGTPPGEPLSAPPPVPDAAPPVAPAGDDAADPAQPSPVRESVPPGPDEPPLLPARIADDGVPADGGAAATEGTDDPWRDRAAERARTAWNAGRTLAERTVREFHLKRSLNHTRAEKEITLKRLGEEACAYLADRGVSHPELAAAVAGIEEVRAKIAAREAEERHLADSPSAPGILNRLKRAVAVAAGYTKVRIEISMLRNELESKTASLGQFIHSRKELFEPLFADSRFLPDLFRRVESLEGEIASLEGDLARLD